MDRGAALEIKSEEGFPPLWYALMPDHVDFSMASKLLEKGASANTICDDESNTLLHCLIAEKNEKGALFLVNQQSHLDVNLTNRMGETALHKAAQNGYTNVVEALLDKDADPNVQTVFKVNEFEDFRQTPLHLAIVEKQISVINELLARKESRNVKPDYNIKNSSGKYTPKNFSNYWTAVNELVTFSFICEP